MNKPLHIQILEYLKENGADDKPVDIATPFLIVADSKKMRIEFKKALIYLEDRTFIMLSGASAGLGGKRASRISLKNPTRLKASITKFGEKEIESPSYFQENSSNIKEHDYTLTSNEADNFRSFDRLSQNIEGSLFSTRINRLATWCIVGMLLSIIIGLTILFILTQ